MEIPSRKGVVKAPSSAAPTMGITSTGMTNYNNNEQSKETDSCEVVNCGGSFEVIIPAKIHTTSHKIFCKAYRTHFSVIEKKNRTWGRGSKRCIQWVFGIVDDIDTFHPRNLRKHEHRVQLVLSNKNQDKGKVYWNNRRVGSLCRSRNRISQVMEFTWKIPSGETIRVVNLTGRNSHASSQERPANCDLFINGQSFFELPTSGSLRSDASNFKCYQTDSLAASSVSDEDDWDDPIYDPAHVDTPHTDNTLEFRLALGGVSPSNSSFSTSSEEVPERTNDIVRADNTSDDLQFLLCKDELHSDLYSSVLESLRNAITYYLPQCEHIMSRAITNVFCIDDDDKIVPYTLPLNVFNLEADWVLKAFQWMKPEDKNNSEDFLQFCLESIVMHVRQERLNAYQASRIILSVARMLCLEFAHQISSNSVLLENLPTHINSDDLDMICSGYGEVHAAIIMSQSSCFGFCRFVKDESVVKLQDAYSQETFIVCNEHPRVHTL